MKRVYVTKEKTNIVEDTDLHRTKTIPCRSHGSLDVALWSRRFNFIPRKQKQNKTLSFLQIHPQKKNGGWKRSFRHRFRRVSDRTKEERISFDHRRFFFALRFTPALV